MRAGIARRAGAEFLGTAFLLLAVVGSGIMAERLSGGNTAIALLANAIATGAALAAIILALGPISGAQMNPVITLWDAWREGMTWSEAAAYCFAQFAGALAGVVAAHAMFSLPLLSASAHIRGGPAQMFSEAVATFGLLMVIWGCTQSRPQAIPFAVGAYITGAYWFTSSTSFANPAVTLARSVTNTFAGIRPADAPGFIAAQLVGAFAACCVFRWLMQNDEV